MERLLSAEISDSDIRDILKKIGIDCVIVKHGKRAAVMQVSDDVSGNRTKEREVRTLLKGSKELKCTTEKSFLS